MINSIDFVKLRNGELLQFNSDFLSIVNLNNPATLNVVNAYTALLIINQSIEQLFKTDQSNPLTEELQNLDARRDDAINGITQVINGYTYHFDETIKAYANKLNEHLALFGTGIAKDNYQSETATLRNIITDWTDKPLLADAITALNLGSWKTELATANTNFAIKYLERTQDLGAVSYDTIKAKRLEAATAFYGLRNKIDAYFTISEGAEPYAKTINELNALIDQYNLLLTNRKNGAVNTPAIPQTPA
jgi:hypothetical protein